MKKSLLFLILAFILGTSAVAAATKTDTWTFDKTPVSGNTYLNGTNYTDYLPDGWTLLGGNNALWKINNTNDIECLVAGNYIKQDAPIVFYAHKGTLTLNMMKVRTTPTVTLWDATPDGDSYTVGTLIDTNDFANVSDETFTDVTLKIKKDGYVAMSVSGSVFIQSVSNTYEAADDTPTETSTVWNFESNTANASGVSLNLTNYKEYLPADWTLLYEWGAWKAIEKNGVQCLKSPSQDNKPNEAIVFYLHKGSLTFDLMKYGYGDPKLHLWKATEADGKFTLGADIAGNAVSGLNESEFKPYTIDIPEDGYYAFCIGGGTFIKSITNTYTAAAQVHSVSGKVIDAQGSPIEGVTVTLTSKSAATDAEGAWTITDMADGTYTATFKKDGYTTQTAEVTIAGADVVVPDVTMPEVITTIHGWVKETSDTTPVPGVTLNLLNGESIVATATTDAEGNYTMSITGAIEPAYSLSLEAPYFQGYTTSVSGLVQGEDNLKNCYLTALKVSFKATVFTPGGSPATGLSVTITPAEGGDAIQAVETGANSGIYTISNLKAYVVADHEYVLDIESEDYDFTPVTFSFDGKSVDETYTLTAKAPTTISGTVTDASDGKALDGADVTLSVDDDPTKTQTATTDADGKYSFTITGTPDLAYTVSVSLYGYNDQTGQIVEVRVGEDNILDFALLSSGVTGIGSIEADATDTDTEIYNMQGVRVNGVRLPAGIYIVNGKKTYIR